MEGGGVWVGEEEEEEEEEGGVLRKIQICHLTASIRERLGCRLGLTGADQADMAQQQLLSHPLSAHCSSV